MNSVAIRVEGLGKQYRIGGKRDSYKTLRETIVNTLNAPIRRAGKALRKHDDDRLRQENQVWALKDISFEVERGQVVGIIGRNGAGKSTLLKILSRITEPTEGYAEIYGRVGSLLEVGTGFHPELSGRENIYLNGAILGMKRVDINRKFDEIVAFAEVEKFIDTPVKHYSTGMYLRLAFSIAAYMEPEILIVDEVLAVGDAQFQKKCLGKMGEVADGGRTVILVSHQMNQIRRLCESCIWINAGSIQSQGDTPVVVSAYEAATTQDTSLKDNGDQLAGKIHFVKWQIQESNSRDAYTLDHFGRVTFRFTLEVTQHIQDGHHGILLYDYEDRIVWSAAVDNIEFDIGVHHLDYELPSFPLHPGPYHWYLTLFNGLEMLTEWHALPYLIIATEPYTHPKRDLHGILNLPWVFGKG